MSVLARHVDADSTFQQGATENAGVENAIRAKLQGWKMQEWKKAGVDSRGGKCRSKLYGAPTRVYIDRILN